MQFDRVQELIQIVWDTINTSDDLRQFIETYQNELDQDFLMGLDTMIEHYMKEGNDEIVTYFQEIREILVEVIPQDPIKEEQEAAVKEAVDLVRLLLQEVTHTYELDQFATDHLADFDDAFFAVLQYLIEQEHKEGNESRAEFYETVSQTLKEKVCEEPYTNLN